MRSTPGQDSRPGESDDPEPRLPTVKSFQRLGSPLLNLSKVRIRVRVRVMVRVRVRVMVRVRVLGC